MIFLALFPVVAIVGGGLLGMFVWSLLRTRTPDINDNDDFVDREHIYPIPSKTTRESNSTGPIKRALIGVAEEIRKEKPNQQLSAIEYIKLGDQLLEEGNFGAAEECYMHALRGGYDRVTCLLNGAICRMLKASIVMSNGMDRRGELIMARKSLEEAYRLSKYNPSVLKGLCEVSYSIGLLLPSKNGNTVEFQKYENILKECDYRSYISLHEGLPGLETLFDR